MTIKTLINKIYIFYFKLINKKKKVHCTGKSIISSGDFFEGNNYIDGTVKDCYVGYGTYIMNQCWFAKCYIGRFCSIASEVKMVQKHGHPLSYVSTSPCFLENNSYVESFVREKNNEKYDPLEYIDWKGKRWDAVVGNDVWIGSRAILLGAVKIGDGAVVGAGAVVTKDVPPYAIVVGNPAKVIGYRFEENKIRKLLNLRWWDKDLDWIREHADLFKNIDKLI